MRPSVAGRYEVTAIGIGIGLFYPIWDSDAIWPLTRVGHGETIGEGCHLAVTCRDRSCARSQCSPSSPDLCFGSGAEKSENFSRKATQQLALRHQGLVLTVKCVLAYFGAPVVELCLSVASFFLNPMAVSAWLGFQRGLKKPQEAHVLPKKHVRIPRIPQASSPKCCAL